ncbi:glycosyltransferase [Cohnella faecalis]|nr:glycosyltransferase [Cohnella faecalis]
MNKHNNYFYSNGLPSNVWTERYLKVFDQMVVCTRVVEAVEDCSKTLKLSSADNVEFDLLSIGVNNISFLSKRKFIEKHIEQAVLKCGYVIARLPSIIGQIGLKYAKKHKKPFLIELVGCPWDAYWNHSLKGKVIAPFITWRTKSAVKTAPYVVYVTNSFLQGRYPTSGKTIGCSNVALTEFDEHVLTKRTDKIKGMSNRPIIIGTTASVNVRYKGQQYIIEAISMLNKQGYNFEYHLVGEGDNSYLRSVAEKFGVTDKVKYLGPMPHAQVFQYLDNIDIYAQPSRQEGLPRALIEAMSRGVPSIGSNTAGIPELLEKESIFKNGNIGDICGILKKMDQKTMLIQAKINFEKSKEYAKSILDERRIEFFKEFRDDVK